MTTHEVIELQPHTLVKWLPPEGVVPGEYAGIARLESDDCIRIVWNDIAEPDSIINRMDRRMLASICICNPTKEGDL